MLWFWLVASVGCAFLAALAMLVTTVRSSAKLPVMALGMNTAIATALDLTMALTYAISVAITVIVVPC